jgi:hypothetical protein
MAPTTSTDRLRAQIDCFNPEAKATKELKIVIKNPVEADHLEGEDLRETLAEDLPVEILFSWENMGASGPVSCCIVATYWCTEVCSTSKPRTDESTDH